MISQLYIYTYISILSSFLSTLEIITLRKWNFVNPFLASRFLALNIEKNSNYICKKPNRKYMSSMRCKIFIHRFAIDLYMKFKKYLQEKIQIFHLNKIPPKRIGWKNVLFHPWGLPKIIQRTRKVHWGVSRLKSTYV